MHESSRRSLCRLAFVLFCVVPTLFVTAWIASRRFESWDGRKAQWEAAMSSRLGLAVTLARLSNPRPGVTLLEGVQLADPETGLTVARMRLVEIADTDHGVVALASQPEIIVTQFGHLWDALHQRILRGSSSRDSAVQFLAQQVTLREPQGSTGGGEIAQTFNDVQCTIETGTEGPRATIKFRLPDKDVTDSAQLRIIRNRQHNPPSTRWELHTGSTPLPCSVGAPYVSSLEQLGRQCAFHGMVWAEQTPTGWDGDVEGIFSQVDLEQLVTYRFPHKLSGMAQVTLSRANFRNGRLVDAAGSVISQGGTVSRSLIDASVASLRLQPNARLEQIQSSPWPYKQLAFGFTINAEGLAISGNCDAAGTLLADARGALLSEPNQSSLPVVALLRTLVPQSEVQVPATKATDALLHALPTPPISTTQEQDTRPPYSPLRLRD